MCSLTGVLGTLRDGIFQLKLPGAQEMIPFINGDPAPYFQLWSCSHCADTEDGGCGGGEGHSRAAKPPNPGWELLFKHPRVEQGINPSLSDFVCCGRPPKFASRGLFDRKSRALLLLGGFCSERVLQGSLFFPSLLLLPFPVLPKFSSCRFLSVLDSGSAVLCPFLWG